MLFAHDHRIFHDADGGFYSAGSFPAAVWERYLRHFDEVHVIARQGGALPDGAELARTDRHGVRFDFLPNLSTFRQLLSPSAEAKMRMKEAVRAADAVVARLPSEIGLLAIRYAQRFRKPYAVEVVGCAWDSYLNNGALSARLYAPLAFVRMQKAVARAPLALYVTSRWLQRRYPTAGCSGTASNVILTPMDACETAARERRLAALESGEPPIVGTVASLQVKSKGVQTALEAIARLRNSGLDLTYRVLGPGQVGPWKALTERLGIADVVHFDGTRDAGQGVRRWLDEIDVHLQPSFQEGLPRATIEAMSRGVACIGSTCGGIPELLPPYRTHKPGDVGGLAEGLRRLASNPRAIAAASRVDRVRAGQYYPEPLQSRRDEVYRQLRRMVEETRVQS